MLTVFTETIDGCDGFRGSLNSLRRGSSSKPRSSSLKLRVAENPSQKHEENPPEK